MEERVEKFVLCRKHNWRDRLDDLAKWWNRQFVDWNLIGVSTPIMRLRWWPAFALLAAGLHDALWLVAVAVSDVAANGSPDSLWLPKITAWFTDLF